MPDMPAMHMKPSAPLIFCLSLFCMLALFPGHDASAQSAGSPAESSALPVTPQALEKTGGIWITDGWRYHPGDDLRWAEPGMPDSAWESVNSLMLPDAAPLRAWKGRGWFRRHITVDSALAGRSLALLIYQAGASEIHVDGIRALAVGTVGAAIDDEVPSQRHLPAGVSWLGAGRHLIAVRYSNHSVSAIGDARIMKGFELCIGFSDALAASAVDAVEENLFRRMIFAMVPLTLALLHLIMFAFYRRTISNLYYSLCMIGFSGIVFFATQQVFASSFSGALLSVRLSYLCENTAIIFGLLLMYSFIGTKVPVHGRVLIGAGCVLAAGAFVGLEATGRAEDAFLVLVVAEMLRGLLAAKTASDDGSWIVGVGMIVLVITLILQLLIGYDVIAPVAGMENGYLYGALALGISMSVYLSRRFAQTNFDLERQLSRIRELSERTLMQERRARDSEIERRVLEADNRRKTSELEEARKVQLSMLPVCVNEIPGYDLCFSMRTATEIGGDYYDFVMADDGTLNIVIGDATGHGMKSALMVAAVKSMFSAMGTRLAITEFFTRCTEIIKDMRLGTLFMSMTLLRLKDGTAELSAAGMPPLVVYRSGTDRIERTVLKGMPLGAHKKFPYQTARLDLRAGDILLLVSDGFTELFNARGQMLEERLIDETLRAHAGCSATEIAEALFTTGERWRNGHPQADDMTCVVVRITAVPHKGQSVSDS